VTETDNVGLCGPQGRLHPLGVKAGDTREGSEHWSTGFLQLHTDRQTPDEGEQDQGGGRGGVERAGAGVGGCVKLEPSAFAQRLDECV
jgi:hypothetical protein